MGKAITRNHKRYVLSLLQSHSGNVDGVDVDAFFIQVMENTDLNPQTIEQILKEQTGQVWKDKGRIFVIQDALLVSESNHPHRKLRDSRQGEGLDGGGLKTQWEWARRSRSKKES